MWCQRLSHIATMEVHSYIRFIQHTILIQRHRWYTVWCPKYYRLSTLHSGVNMTRVDGQWDLGFCNCLSLRPLARINCENLATFFTYSFRMVEPSTVIHFYASQLPETISDLRILATAAFRNAWILGGAGCQEHKTCARRVQLHAGAKTFWV